MFEQQLYDQEVSEVRTQPGDLFHEYEIREWNLTPLHYKILGFSAVFNVLALVVIASSGLLTARGCDSPFVGRVCQVLDTVYIAQLVFGTDTEYADVDYTKTELEDADVTFVDVTGVTPPLNYPPGYFQIANPEQFTTPIDPMAGFGPNMIPGIPNPTMGNPTLGGSGLINTPAIKPKRNPNAIDGKLPTDGPLGTAEDNPTIAGNQKGGKKPLDDTSANGKDANTNVNTNTANPTVAENKEEAKEDQFGVFINKRPMRDRAKESLEKIDANAVRIDSPFKVVIAGTLGPGKDGKTIVLKNPKPVVENPPTKNDPVMEKFVQDWIIAVGDAGWFGYLDKLKAKKIVITVEQNDTELIATVKSDQPSENDAKLAASGIRGILSIASAAATGDNLMFLQKGTATNEGKSFFLNFKIEKPIVQEMILRKLAESKDKEPKPEGNALAKPNDNTARK